MSKMSRRQAIQASVLSGVAVTAPIAYAQDDKADGHGANAEEAQVPNQFTFDWAAEEEKEVAEEGEVSTSSEQYTEGPAELLADRESQQCVKVGLFKIRGWPEFKTEIKKHCKKTPFGKVCVNLPQLFTRNCELEAFTEVCHPDAANIRGDIENCVKQAVVAGVVTGIVTSGNLAAAAGVLKTYLVGCLANKLGERVNQISVSVRTESKCGSWKPR